MTPDEQAFMDRVDGALASLEVRVPSAQRLRQMPMDMIAVAVMRRLARVGAVLPFSDRDLQDALLDIHARNSGSVATVIAASF